jgi:hypothetical protein
MTPRRRLFHSQLSTIKLVRPSGREDLGEMAVRNQVRQYAELAIGQRLRYRIELSPRSGKDQAVDVTLLEPIISPTAPVHAFRAESTPRYGQSARSAPSDLDVAEAHMRFATEFFGKR